MTATPTDIEITGRVVDVVAGAVFPGRVRVVAGRIASVEKTDTDETRYILPGLVDAHVHVESSMLVPTEFARLAVVHGTVATVSDPHEIANVLGIEGVRFMIDDGKRTPFKFAFGAPSCVPATPFETAGANIDAAGVETLLDMDEIHYLAEMMNFPGVLARRESVMAKIAAARERGMVVDGHAPGLIGEDVRRYAEVGIQTDHECATREEGLARLDCGMKILIREGSAAKNFEELISLLREYPDEVMFCSDDKHPDDLVRGHVNKLLARAVAAGCDPLTAIRAATLNPVRFYGLDVGLLQPGDPADLIVVDSLETFGVTSTYVDGVHVAREGWSLLKHDPVDPPNHFVRRPIAVDSLRVESRGDRMRAIRILDGQIVTGSTEVDVQVENGAVMSDPGRDLYKIVVVNRYADAPPAVAFAEGVGLRAGAFASSVAHDSHNIVAIGVDDASLAQAINLVVEAHGGVSVVGPSVTDVLPLPVAGLMSDRDGYKVARRYEAIDAEVKNLGCHLTSPYMTLSFLALLVIPELKLSDRGLFDVRAFEFVDLFV